MSALQISSHVPPGCCPGSAAMPANRPSALSTASLQFLQPDRELQILPEHTCKVSSLRALKIAADQIVQYLLAFQRIE